MWKGGRRPEVSLIHRKRRIVSFIFVTCPFSMSLVSTAYQVSLARLANRRNGTPGGYWRLLQIRAKHSLEPYYISFNVFFFFFLLSDVESVHEVEKEVSSFERWCVLRDLAC